MTPDNYADAALVLIGHGSTLNAESAAPTHQHADTLRKRSIFAQVKTCFWKEQPGISAVLRGVFAKRVFLVPLFISEGYFTEQVVPRELGFRGPEDTSFDSVQQRGDQTLHYCGPVGTHPGMTQVILSRAHEVLKKYPFPSPPRPPDTTLFIAGHGTGNNQNSRKAIDHQVEIIAKQGEFAAVHAVFMEEDPPIGSVYELAQTPNIVVVPFFISDGLHSYEDIPEMLGEPRRLVQMRLNNGKPTWRNPSDKRGKRIWYSRSIGDSDRMPEVILERVREAARRR